MKTRMRFLRHAESIGPMWPKSKSKPNPGAGTVPPPAGRPRAQVKERVGRAAPFSSSAMSSGRLSLDRVARQHCPSPFHRQAHPKSVPGSGTIDFQRTVNSVLTVCLSRGDNPISSSASIQDRAFTILFVPTQWTDSLNGISGCRQSLREGASLVRHTGFHLYGS
jgi:hypothetical protein